MAKIEARRLGRARRRQKSKQDANITRYVDDFFQSIECAKQAIRTEEPKQSDIDRYISDFFTPTEATETPIARF